MSPAPGYVPERGDAIGISLNPQAGHERAGRRPAVVLARRFATANQIKSLDWRARRAERICALPEETMAEVIGKLATLLPGIA